MARRNHHLTMEERDLMLQLYWRFGIGNRLSLIHTRADGTLNWGNLDLVLQMLPSASGSVVEFSGGDTVIISAGEACRSFARNTSTWPVRPGETVYYMNDGNGAPGGGQSSGWAHMFYAGLHRAGIGNNGDGLEDHHTLPTPPDNLWAFLIRNNRQCDFERIPRVQIGSTMVPMTGNYTANANGRILFPNGLTIQWGSISVTAAGAVVPFTWGAAFGVLYQTIAVATMANSLVRVVSQTAQQATVSSSIAGIVRVVGIGHTNP